MGLNDRAEEMMGKAKEKIGEKTDNKDLQAEGAKEETSGKLGQAGDKVKDAAKKMFS